MSTTPSIASASNAMKNGQYALGNLFYVPAKNVTMGGELQWGRRANFSDGFHTFGVEWTPDGVAWFVDGVERRRTTAGAAALDNGGAFYTILNSQVIDPDSTCGEVPAESAEYVDYVRVWSAAPAPPPAAAPGVPVGENPVTGPGPGPGADCGLPVRVRATLPITKGGNTVALLVWFDRTAG